MILAGSGRFSFTTDRRRPTRASRPTRLSRGRPSGSPTARRSFDADRPRRLERRGDSRSGRIPVSRRGPPGGGGFAIHSMGAMGTLLNGHPVEHRDAARRGPGRDRVHEACGSPGRPRAGASRWRRRTRPGTTSPARRPTLEPAERVVVDEDESGGPAHAAGSGPGRTGARARRGAFGGR